MFGSSALDVAIGLVFLYLLLSLLCTAINEVLEAAVQRRGEYLRYGIAELLGVAPNADAGTWVYQFVSWVSARSLWLLSWCPWALSWLPWLFGQWDRLKKWPADRRARFWRELKRDSWFGTRMTELDGWFQRLKGRFGLVAPPGLPTAGLLTRVYTHPLVASLYSGTYGTDAVRLPAYIPSRQFALALLDIVRPAGASGSGAAFAVAGARADPNAVAQHIADLRAAVAAAGNGLTDEVRAALLALIDAAGNDMERVRDGIEKWYDGTMDRVAGWYRRRVQYVSVAVGAVMAVALNADTFAIADSLARDQVLRATVASAADNYAKAHAPVEAQTKADEKAKTDGKAKADEKTQTNDKVKSDEKAKTAEQKAADVKAALDNVSKGVNEVRGFGWPLGWDRADDRTVLPDPLRRVCDAEPQSYQWKLRSVPIGDPPRDAWWVWDWRAFGGWLIKALGWVLTAAAISLGAPFWFDILNRLIVVRSTVKPTEKSPDEPSADKK